MAIVVNVTVLTTAAVWLAGCVVTVGIGPLPESVAALLVIEPNHAHARAMLDEELDAKAQRVGLWGACGDEP